MDEPGVMGRVYANVSRDDAYAFMRVFDTHKLRDHPANPLIGRMPLGTAPVGVAVIDSGAKSS